MNLQVCEGDGRLEKEVYSMFLPHFLVACLVRHFWSMLGKLFHVLTVLGD